jgi:hypothetical protein
MLEPGIPWTNRFDNHIRLEPGKSYRVSAWVYGRVSIQAALFGKNEEWLGRYQPIMEGGHAGGWVKLEGVLTIKDPDAEYFDFEVTPVDERVYVDDVGVWLQ